LALKGGKDRGEAQCTNHKREGKRSSFALLSPLRGSRGKKKAEAIADGFPRRRGEKSWQRANLLLEPRSRVSGPEFHDPDEREGGEEEGGGAPGAFLPFESTKKEKTRGQKVVSVPSFSFRPRGEKKSKRGGGTVREVLLKRGKVREYVPPGCGLPKVGNLAEILPEEEKKEKVEWPVHRGSG